MKIGQLVTAEGNRTTTLWDRSPADLGVDDAYWRADLEPGAVALVLFRLGEGEEAVLGVIDSQNHFGWNWAAAFEVVA